MGTYYLSKYALTDGIKKVEVDVSPCVDGFVYIKGHWRVYKLGGDIHKTEAEALAAAEAMRVKKIASLKKQIAKLEAVTFEVKS